MEQEKKIGMILIMLRIRFSQEISFRDGEGFHFGVLKTLVKRSVSTCLEKRLKSADDKEE